ncbi:MAG TPA: glycogen-binding domain-containing protein [Saprospiraceae bacterium]|nr:glycogen-binding domain-containing protein [Saprospiraceae bacterium]
MKMKYYLKLIVGIVLLWVTPAMTKAQQAANPYYLDGEDVVFVFDVRNYAKALQSQNKEKVDFADLKIHDVAISGKFNAWSKNGWHMEKKGEFVFELRKKILDFNDAFPLEFRYIINGKYIADLNQNEGKNKNYSDEFLRDVYKLDLSVLKCTDQGNTRFFLKGYPLAKEVILAGTFNGWDEHTTLMQKTADGWELKADLPPGRYEYKFIVDGIWMHDPVNKEHVLNEHGTLNSVLNVSVSVTFNLKGFPDARKVILTGSFVNWNENKIMMTNVNGVWTTTLQLSGGKHLYKYIINGQWHTDPTNPIVEDDGKGNLNSVLFVH